MHLYVSAFSYITFTTGIFLLFLVYYLWQKRHVAGAQFFTYLLLATAVWSISAAFEASVGTMDASIFWSKVSYIGIVFSGPSWFLFTLEYADNKKSLIQILSRILYSVASLFLILAWTNELHRTLWTSFSRIGDEFGTTVYGHGITFYFHLGFQYILILLGIIILINSIAKSQKGTYTQRSITIISALIPLFGNAIYILFPELVGYLDITPMVFAITGILTLINLYRYNFYKALPEVQKAIYENLGSGIILVDKDNKIVEINNPARILYDKKYKIGQKFEDIKNDDVNGEVRFFENVGRWYEVRNYTIGDYGGVSDGKVFFLYDVSKRQEILKEFEDSKRLQTIVLDFMPDIIFVADIDKKIILWNKRAELITGVPSSKALGKTTKEVSKLAYGKTRPMLIDLLSDNKLSTQSNYEGINREGDTLSTYGDYKGKKYWFIAKPLYNQDGEQIGAIESGRDVSAQLSKQEELQDRINTLMKLNDILVKREERISKLTEELEELKSQKE